jgi:acyl carrier protein
MDVIEAAQLDSLTFVDLRVRLEGVFDMTISVESVELDDFRTARAIADYLVRHRGVVV